MDHRLRRADAPFDEFEKLYLGAFVGGRLFSPCFRNNIFHLCELSFGYLLGKGLTSPPSR